MTGFCTSQVSSRFKDNIAIMITLSGLGKDHDFSKTMLTGDEIEKHNASCDLTLPKISVSLIRPHSANLIGLIAYLF
jgi:hypothetical protein